MKKIVMFALILSLAGVAPMLAQMDAKKIACEAGCKKTYDDCMAKAGNDFLKKTGCEEANKSCLKKCKESK